MSNHWWKSVPTQPWRLGCGCKSGWADPIYKSLVCTRFIFVLVCVLCVFLVFSFALFGFCAGYKGPAEERSNVTAKTQLRFTWHLLCEGLNDTCDVELLCHHAIKRGVHLPKAWKSKWYISAGVPPVDALAREAVQRVRDEFSLSDATKLDCRPSFL